MIIFLLVLKALVTFKYIKRLVVLEGMHIAHHLSGLRFKLKSVDNKKKLF